MKNSYIETIGDIPSNWKLKRLKYLCTIETGNQNTQDAISNGAYPFYVRSPIIEKSNSFSFDGEGILMAGDGAGAGRIFHHAYGKYAVHQRVYRLANFKDIHTTYLFYFLDSLFCKEMDKGSAQSTVPSVRLPMLTNFYICIPTKIEQEKIVDFLDKKCTEIDKLKTDIEKQIAILGDYKKSLITETVTKGLDPDVEMKDSGIEWIGEIPKQWQVKRIKYIATLSGRIGWQGLTSSEYCDEGAYLITGVNFSNGDIDWDSCVHISEERWEEAEQIQIKNDDLLITKDGTVGKIAIVRNMPGKTSLNSGVLLIRIEKSCDKKFLYWILKSNIFWKWFYTINSGNSTIIHLYQNDFYNFSFPLMDINEQKEIADFLDDKCAKIDEIIELKRKQIAKIDEYKKSLIYEYVTGKKEVY